THWAYQAVRELQIKGILRGYPDGSVTEESPQSCWRTLLMALRTGNEQAVRRRTTAQAFAHLRAFPDTMPRKVESEKARRLARYRSLAERWSRAQTQWASQTEMTALAILTPDFGVEPFKDDAQTYVEFVKTAEGWKMRRYYKH